MIWSCFGVTSFWLTLYDSRDSD